MRTAYYRPDGPDRAVFAAAGFPAREQPLRRDRHDTASRRRPPRHVPSRVHPVCRRRRAARAVAPRLGRAASAGGRVGRVDRIHRHDLPADAVGAGAAPGGGAGRIRRRLRRCTTSSRSFTRPRSRPGSRSSSAPWSWSSMSRSTPSSGGVCVRHATPRNGVSHRSLPRSGRVCARMRMDRCDRRGGIRSCAIPERENART